jgi:CPA1 family monovalent cation:H+ antiporter
MEALPVMLSLVSLLFIATGVFFISRRTSIPYTILLVIVGLLLIPVSRIAPFEFFQSFTLTPGLLFFVFLPTLIFESAYNMNVRRLLGSWRSISLLSVVSLVISAFFIGVVLEFVSRWIGFPLPFSVTLLFGALISATDPVAVLALFKEYGPPKRLSLMFEGESLFNDGTSLALFLVLLEILQKQYTEGVLTPETGGMMANIMEGGAMFLTMVFGGALFGLLMGAVFSKLIQQVRDNESIEITLTMIVAHSTFILSELISHSLSIGGHSIHLSSIIATVVAAMVVGNYGRYKISPSVLEYMEHFWGYFAFVSNSIIFILIGLLFASLPISLRDILPITLLSIVIVAAGRALSIYPVMGFLNWRKKEAHIPASWQHLLAWGSLRGALAVTMVLLIPDNFTVPGWQHAFTVKEFIIALTIACIYFTLFIKGTTIGPMIKWFKLDMLNTVEFGEYHETKALVYAKVLLEIERFNGKGYITKEAHSVLKEKYEALYKESCAEGKHAFQSAKGIPERVLAIYALATAKHSLKTLFVFNEVNETVYKKILNDLTRQLERAEESKEAVTITLADFRKDWFDAFHDLQGAFFTKDPAYDEKTLYMYYRAQSIIVHKSIEEIEYLAGNNLQIFENDDLFDSMLKRLAYLQKGAKMKAGNIERKYESVIEPLALSFAEAGIFKAEKHIASVFNEREVITPKVYSLLIQEIKAAHG